MFVQVQTLQQKVPGPRSQPISEGSRREASLCKLILSVTQKPQPMPLWCLSQRKGLLGGTMVYAVDVVFEKPASVLLPLISLSPSQWPYSPASDWLRNGTWWNEVGSDVWGWCRGGDILGEVSLLYRKMLPLFPLDLVMSGEDTWKSWHLIAMSLRRKLALRTAEQSLDLDDTAELLLQQNLRPWPVVSVLWDSKFPHCLSQLLSGILFLAAKSILMNSKGKYGQCPNISVFRFFFF